MKFQIQQNKLRDEVKKKIFDGFGSQAVESTGINGLSEDPISCRKYDFSLPQKILKCSEAQKKITRIGVYGVAKNNGKILTVRQQRGPYAGKLDFPGGGIEFGESAEQAMRREFAEEVAMEFDSMQLIDNLTATVDVPSTPFNEPYLFYQIGMIYQVNGCRLTNEPRLQELEHIWIDPQTLSKDQCSSLLWEYKQTYINGLRNE